MSRHWKRVPARRSLALPAARNRTCSFPPSRDTGHTGWDPACPGARMVLERRKPMLLFRLAGSLLFRLAERQFPASLFQLPPRFTRFVPEAAPSPVALYSCP